MGMAPETPSNAHKKKILELLETAEREIQAQQPNGPRAEKEWILKRIQKLKYQLPSLSEYEEDILVMSMSIGDYWGETVPKPGQNRYTLFDQTGNTKENRTAGKKGPGRPANKLIEIMSALITPSSPYSEEQCLSDIICHYKQVKELIRRPQRGDGKIHHRNGKTVNLRSIRDQLVKRSKLSPANPATK